MNDVVKNTIIRKLNNQFQVQFLRVVNESEQHNVPINSETHFKVTLVSVDFLGKALVARHQSVYQILQQEMATGVHALALHIYTPEEWFEKGQDVADSPQCMGGSGKQAE